MCAVIPVKEEHVMERESEKWEQKKQGEGEMKML